MFCKNCGSQLPDHSTFCSACGTQQGDSISPAQAGGVTVSLERELVLNKMNNCSPAMMAIQEKENQIADCKENIPIEQKKSGFLRCIGFIFLE
ncbi:MAG: zinc ribbon domain-containing protein [Oscillospiraceae bacterium]|nr:zinc ribbon domain-containing protein [Oscillospiraceae bacterium]